MSERARWLGRLAGPALVVAVAVALLAGEVDGLQLPSPRGGPAEGLADAVAELAPESIVLVGFDADLGTYAEIRPTVRALLADLVEAGARLAVVSLTPEGRALALAEIDRLVRTGEVGQGVADLGFVPGAEAAIVALARSIAGDAAVGLGGPWPADELAARPALVVVVGGNDVGPRSWVEQLRPRVPDLPLVGVVPTVLLPETRPYLASGQLDALVATPRDGAAYRATVGGLDEEAGVTPLALVIGVLAGAAWLGAGLFERARRSVRANGAAGEPA